jgi:hypothetical protein
MSRRISSGSTCAPAFYLEEETDPRGTGRHFICSHVFLFVSSANDSSSLSQACVQPA